MMIVAAILSLQIAQAEPPKWARRSEAEGVVALELASRRYAAEDHPDLWLVGVAHIADAEYYAVIDTLLKEADIVLYESVAPSGTRPPGGATMEERVESTTRSLEFAADVAKRVAEQSGVTFDNLDDVISQSNAIDPRISVWLGEVSRDAWGNLFVLEQDAGEGTVTVVSLGSDGAAGGEGEAADIRISRSISADASEDSEEGGNIQQQLADVLGLAFQLDSLPYDHPDWQCSDLTMDEVARRLEEEGASTELLETVAGTSLPAKLASSIMQMFPALDAISGGSASATARLLIMEMLAMPDSDRVLQGIEPELHVVIIEDRNKAVIADLERLLADDADDDSTIAVLYGAGHMVDMAERLDQSFGYVPVEERWLPSMTASIDETMLSRRDLLQLRFNLRYQLHSMSKETE